MFIFRLASKEQVREAEVTQAVLKILEESKKEINQQTVSVSPKIIGYQQQLAAAAGGIEKLVPMLREICNSGEPKYDPALKYTASFMFGLSLTPSFSLDSDQNRILSEDFKAEISNMLSDPNLAATAIQAAEWSLISQKLAMPLLRLKAESKSIMLKNWLGENRFEGNPQSMGRGFIGTDFYQDLQPTILQAIPIQVFIPPEVDVSYLTPGGQAYLDNIYTPTQRFKNRTLTDEEFVTYQKVLASGVDAWLAAVDLQTGKQVKESVTRDLDPNNPNATLANFVTMYKSGNIEGANSLFKKGSVMATSFGIDAGLTYGQAQTFLSGQNMNDLVERAFTTGLVVTKNLSKSGRFGFAVVLDHGVVTLAKTTGLGDIHYNVIGARVLLNIPEVNVKLGAGAGAVSISDSKKFIDAIRLDFGGSWEYGLSNSIHLILHGKAEGVIYPGTGQEKPSSFFSYGGGARVKYTLPTKYVDIESYIGLSGIAKGDLRAVFGTGLTNVTIGPGALSLYFDASAPLPIKRSESEFIGTKKFTDQPYMGLRLTYRF